MMVMNIWITRSRMLCYHTGKLHICMFSNGLGFGFMNLNFVEKPKYEMTLDGIVRGQEKNAFHISVADIHMPCKQET